MLMKRVALVAVLATVAMAALAPAASRRYTGRFADPRCGSVPAMTCEVSFRGVTKKGEVRRVTRFLETGVPAKCDEGIYALNSDGNALPTMKVKRGSFKGKFRTTDGKRTITVRGTLFHHYKRASGTYRLRGDFAANPTNCDSGAVPFTASR
jgi:hypothetical protein